MNKVQLIGRITKDVELRKVGEDNSVVNFTLAVNRPYKSEDGSRVADFIQCSVFGKPADFMAKYVKKGQLLAITGSIQTRNYEDSTGATRYVTEVRVDEVESLEAVEKKLDTVEAVDGEIKRIKAEMTEKYNYGVKGLKTAAEKTKLKDDIAASYKADLDKLEAKKQAILIEQDPFKGEAPF